MGFNDPLSDLTQFIGHFSTGGLMSHLTHYTSFRGLFYGSYNPTKSRALKDNG